MLKLKLQYFGHLMWTANSLEIFLMLGKTERRRRRWWSEDEMAGWHYWCNGHELEQTLGDGEEQGGLACCSPLGLKESDSTGWLNNNNTPLVPALMPGTPLSQAFCICYSWATLQLSIGLAKKFIQVFPSAGLENLNEFLASLIATGVISYLQILLRCHLLNIRNLLPNILFKLHLPMQLFPFSLSPFLIIFLSTEPLLLFYVFIYLFVVHIFLPAYK